MVVFDFLSASMSFGGGPPRSQSRRAVCKMEFPQVSPHECDACQPQKILKALVMFSLLPVRKNILLGCPVDQDSKFQSSIFINIQRKNMCRHKISDVNLKIPSIYTCSLKLCSIYRFIYLSICIYIYIRIQYKHLFETCTIVVTTSQLHPSILVSHCHLQQNRGGAKNCTGQ